jgi:hemolysin activation/secretion protein
MAVGGSLGYDLSMGDWLLSLGYTQQIYENQVHGILEDFQTSGDTRNGRLSLARMLYRSQSTRLSLALHGNYSDVGNYLDEATIQVSSYWLRKVGASLDIKRQWPGAEWQVSPVASRATPAALPSGQVSRRRTSASGICTSKAAGHWCICP